MIALKVGAVALSLSTLAVGAAVFGLWLLWSVDEPEEAPETVWQAWMEQWRANR